MCRIGTSARTPDVAIAIADLICRVFVPAAPRLIVSPVIAVLALTSPVVVVSAAMIAEAFAMPILSAETLTLRLGSSGRCNTAE